MTDNPKPSKDQLEQMLAEHDDISTRTRALETWMIETDVTMPDNHRHLPGDEWDSLRDDLLRAYGEACWSEGES